MRPLLFRPLQPNCQPPYITSYHPSFSLKAVPELAAVFLELMGINKLVGLTVKYGVYFYHPSPATCRKPDKYILIFHEALVRGHRSEIHITSDRNFSSKERKNLHIRQDYSAYSHALSLKLLYFLQWRKHASQGVLVFILVTGSPMNWPQPKVIHFAFRFLFFLVFAI